MAKPKQGSTVATSIHVDTTQPQGPSPPNKTAGPGAAAGNGASRGPSFIDSLPHALQPVAILAKGGVGAVVHIAVAVAPLALWALRKYIQWYVLGFWNKVLRWLRWILWILKFIPK